MLLSDKQAPIAGARGRATMHKSCRAAVFLLFVAIGVPGFAVPAVSRPETVKRVPLPRPRPTSTATVRASANPQVIAAAFMNPEPLERAARPAVSETEIAAVKRTIELLRSGKRAEASEFKRTIDDPLARKLAEWIFLRDDDNDADFSRYNAFILENPGWPSLGMFRRRAEAMLWLEHVDPSTVRVFFASLRPLSCKGRLALARALLAHGDRVTAQAYVSETWRLDPMPRELEAQVHDEFHDLITPADDKARMAARFYANDNEAALRAAERLGGMDLAIAQAWMAVNTKAANAYTLLEAVPTSAHGDARYVFSRVQWLRHNDKIAGAGQLMLTAPRNPAELYDVDEWWIERRVLARKLLDIGESKSAYLIVRDAAQPSKENYRVEQMFTAGWIALRFLHDPTTAASYFARIPEFSQNPIALARSGYWMGRALEATNRQQEARVHYQGAAQYATAYYGQLARARLGLGQLTLAQPPRPTTERRAALAQSELVRAAQILYAADARDLVAPMVADLAEKLQDSGELATLAEIAGTFQDARAMHLIGKAALGRGLPFDYYAFPTVGIPSYRAIGPAVEPAVVFAIVKQESAFNPLDVSSARALGIMQVTPDAGRYVARKFKVPFDQKRLLHDTAYNLQMGAAELGGDIEEYGGSYILAFAAYNAGSGRVREWLAQYGDPRDPRIDPIDWVERIPFSETRNYVQRILENLQVYRVRFGKTPRLLIEADLHRGAVAN
jgi:soluble lytic murein transglycosylase